MLCQQIKANGQPCTFKAKYNGYCGMHRRLPRPTDDAGAGSGPDIKQCPCYRTDGSQCNRLIPIGKPTCHAHRNKCKPVFAYRYDIDHIKERMDDEIVELVERIFSNPDNFTNLSVFTVLRSRSKDTYDAIVRSGKLTGKYDKNSIKGVSFYYNDYQCVYFSLF